MARKQMPVSGLTSVPVPQVSGGRPIVATHEPARHFIEEAGLILKLEGCDSQTSPGPSVASMAIEITFERDFRRLNMTHGRMHTCPMVVWVAGVNSAL